MNKHIYSVCGIKICVKCTLGKYHFLFNSILFCLCLCLRLCLCLYSYSFYPIPVLASFWNSLSVRQNSWSSGHSLNQRFSYENKRKIGLKSKGERQRWRKRETQTEENFIDINVLSEPSQCRSWGNPPLRPCYSGTFQKVSFPVFSLRCIWFFPGNILEFAVSDRVCWFQKHLYVHI